jgi:signal transduction histidine kinase
VGEGITGRVAESGESFYTPNALEVEWAVQIEGTDDVVESILAVPLTYGDRVTGVIVLSSLGEDLFDDEDMRLLEVLASHAAVAFENARLLQLEREAAETSSALLALSTSLTQVHDVQAVLDTTVRWIPDIVPSAAAAAYVRDQGSDAFVLTALHAAEAGLLRPRDEVADLPSGVAQPPFRTVTEPFVFDREAAEQVPPEYWLVSEPRESIVAPLRWEPDGFGALVVIAPEPDARFGERELLLSRGIADTASLALGTARRFHELERFHELVEGLDAIFWEADPTTLRFTFLSARAGDILGPELSRWAPSPQRWGDHVDARDRGLREKQLRAGIAAGAGRSLEYRSAGSANEPIWLRDLISVVRDPKGDVARVRGLIVDITDRKAAEQALKRSEQKFSEAFEREREASSRLRLLDDMKNTFLEAVSHDLRTPLTSILGSAITLEQTRLDMPRDDALDLVHRIATNARKLERLLSDLLDLDRLQRGIVSPRRRPTDVGALVRLCIEQTELVAGRELQIDASPVIASVDAAKVERIIENLLVNAVRHAPGGARLWVRVAPERNGVHLVVEDDGPGVPEALRESIFDPFQQLPGSANPSPGVGIGLSLVARFAELHGGRAWVEDRRGGGAAFHVLLPGDEGPDVPG